MATAPPGRSESLPDRAESSAAWELESTARKTSGDYSTSITLRPLEKGP
jgi:hypothetical protein